MKDFWNERYAHQEYAYGVHPNQFLEDTISTLPIHGKIFFPAEGEGRNAVFAAKKGFQVFAFDLSCEGKNKADKLADDFNVKIDYQVGKIDDLDYEQAYFDGIVLIYAHFPMAIRKKIHLQLLRFVKPKGIVIFEAFSKEQLQFNSGGPKDFDMLFSEEEIKNEFPNVKFDFLKTEVIQLKEGEFHQGKASVIRFVGIKEGLN